ncbi:hypothetical protein ABIC07_006059 [Bradyrhizobium sp. RT9a]
MTRRRLWLYQSLALALTGLALAVIASMMW